jgi:predicted HNH restriction endonuclease
MTSKARRAENPEHYREYDRKWRAANPERVRAKQQKWLTKNPAYTRNWKRDLRQKAIQQLGGVCARCQWADMRCLQIDHIISLGQSNGRDSVKLYIAILEGHTDNLQLLCANCHAIKTYEEDEPRT